eukprot:TRINITY_DN595_c1_g1_i1.p1 TRINITY_DN595_c1_g1~~TRINITY_DN595_c1_g1_i1.p1  ORF type:complete len:906 (+),score=62.24 TRINITY_DN595_c1_g1_i1:384-3101(+)
MIQESQSFIASFSSQKYYVYKPSFYLFYKQSSKYKIMLARQRSNSFEISLLSDFEQLLFPSTNSQKPACLPAEVYDQFKAANHISDLIPWQKHCLEQLKPEKNFVVKAPTGAGKSLLSDLFGLHCLFSKSGTKVLYVVPYVSLMHERADKLRAVCERLGLRCASLNSGHGFAFSEYDIIICTVERANAIICEAIRQNYLNSISGVIVDEAQFLADETRGGLLEILLTKLNVLQKTTQLKVFLISATMGNAVDLAKWMNADLFISDEQTTTVTEFVKAGSRIYTSKGELKEILEEAPNDYFKIISAVRRTMEKGSVLIFAPSKYMCETLAGHLSKHLLVGNEKDRNEILNEMKYIKFHHFTNQSQWLLKGVACHHAGMKMEERRLIEKYFRKSAIKALICTSTLATGVNLPAKTVLVFGLEIGNARITNAMYRQMCGRAGRMQKDLKGECMILCRESQLDKALKLQQGSVQGTIVESTLREEQIGLKRLVLEAVCLKLANTKTTLMLYGKNTLWFSMLSKVDYAEAERRLKGSLKEAIAFLKENELIVKEDKKYTQTKLGAVICETGLYPEEMLAAYFDLLRARTKILLGDRMCLTYLVTPIILNIKVNWDVFLKIYRRLAGTNKELIDLLGIDEEYILMCTQVEPVPLTSTFFKGKLITHEVPPIIMTHCRHVRFYHTLILCSLITGVDIQTICSTYKVSQGQLQSLLAKTPIFTKKVVQLAKGLNWHNLHAILAHYQDSVTFGQSEELEELLGVGNLSVPQARAIFEAGYTGLQHLAYANPSHIMNALLHAIDWDKYYTISSEKAHAMELTNFLLPSMSDAQELIITARKEYIKRKRAATLHRNRLKHHHKKCNQCYLQQINTKFINQLKYPFDNPHKKNHSICSYLHMHSLLQITISSNIMCV